MATEEEGEEPKQAEQEGDHRAGILSGSKLRDQPFSGICRDRSPPVPMGKDVPGIEDQWIVLVT